MKDLYVNIDDYQGTDFAIGRTGTIEQWREQALEWADSNDNEELYEFMEKVDHEKVIESINDIWQINIIKCDMLNKV